VSRVSEKADYLSHTDTPFLTVSSQAASDISGSYSRCSGFFAAYRRDSEASLLATPIQKSFSTNTFKGSLNYTIDYTNSFSVTSQGYWDYSIDINQSRGGIFSADERGEIIGFGHIIDEKYNNASALWSNVLVGISGRVSSAAYYNGFYTPSTHSVLRLASDSVTFNRVEGKINYSQKYSDQDSILSTTDIRKAVVTINTENNRKLATSFFIPNKKEILQVQPNLLPNMLRYSVKLNGRSNVTIPTYLSSATGYLPIIGGNQSKFISDCSYSYNPFDRSFVLNTTITSLPEGE
jgi:hypothetical protein